MAEVEVGFTRDEASALVDILRHHVVTVSEDVLEAALEFADRIEEAAEA